MKSFKQFLNQNIPVLDTPIHFKHIPEPEDVFAPEPINENETPVGDITEWEIKNDNRHIHPDLIDDAMVDEKTLNKASKVLMSNQTPKTRTRKHEVAINDYTIGSKEMNVGLAKNARKMTTLSYFADTIKELDDAVAKHPSPHDYTVYSGVSSRRTPQMLGVTESNNRFRVPSFTSTTINKSMALSFANDKGWQRREPVRHIYAIHIREGDPAMHLGKLSHHDGESETLIGRNTTFEHLGTDHYGSEGTNYRYQVHHLRIARD